MLFTFTVFVVEVSKRALKTKVEDFENAIRRYQAMRQKQAEEKNRLKVVEIKTANHITVENKILLRIAREKNIDVARLVSDEY